MASEVKVKVGLESGAVGTGLNKVKAQFAQFRSGLNSSFGSFIALGALEEGLRRLIEKGSHISDLADRFGVSTEALQRFGNVAEQDGGNLETVAKAFNKLTVAREDAQRGLKETIDSFKGLGITMEEVKNSSIEELMYKIADATTTTTDRARTQADVIKLLGRSAGELYITMERGSKAIREQGEALGVMSDDTVRNLDKIGDDLNAFKNRIFVFGGGILTFFAKITSSIGELFGTAFSAAARQFETFGKAFNLARQGSFIEAGKTLASGISDNIRATLNEARQVRLGVKDAFKDLGQEAFGVGNGSGKRSLAPAVRRGVVEDRVNDADEKKEQTRLEKLATLRERLAEIQRTASNDQLDAEAKINALIAQRATLQKAAAGEKDAEKKLEFEIKAAEIGKEIFNAQKALNDSIAAKKTTAPTIAADALRRIGGGGNAAVTGADPNLREQKLHSKLLEQIAKNTQAKKDIELKLK